MGQNSKGARNSRVGTPTAGVAGGQIRPSPTTAKATAGGKKQILQADQVGLQDDSVIPDAERRVN
jgi:hypothetical protein